MQFIELFQVIEAIDGTPEGLIPAENFRQITIESVHFHHGLENIYNTTLRIGTDQEISLGNFFKPAGNLTSPVVSIQQSFDFNGSDMHIKMLSKYAFHVIVYFTCS